MVGSGGEQEFVFEALGKGETDIVLGYKRSWENSTGKTHNVHVNITD